MPRTCSGSLVEVAEQGRFRLATTRRLQLQRTQIVLTLGQPIEHPREGMYAAVNARGVLATGTAGALRMRGGPDLERALRLQAPLLPGRAYGITPPSERLAAMGVRLVLFGVTARDTGVSPRREFITEALAHGLQLAAGAGLRSLTLPEVATTLPDTSLEAAADLLRGVLVEHVRRSSVLGELAVVGSHLVYLRYLRDALLSMGARNLGGSDDDLDSSADDGTSKDAHTGSVQGSGA